uniref:CAZy families GH32 protein n=1 Tax=uncultured Prevotella sp. TaxID=159272 RepID=A0A060CL13_9BACT|nr:CAZy families GH32 protein [uncultured Prevotella sp.]
MEKSTETSESNGKYSLNNNSYILFNRLNTHNKISFTVKTASNADKFGFSLVRGTDSQKYYSMIINPEDNNNKRK